jgi:hypothetical protein
MPTTGLLTKRKVKAMTNHQHDEPPAESASTQPNTAAIASDPLPKQ